LKEFEQILDLWAQAEGAGESGVLATVVKTRGSSYRLPGARLLLTSKGRRAGTISGGCLEDDLIKKAWWLTESGAVIRRYDTTPDGELGAGFGLGCNGIIHVLLERLEAGNAPALEVMGAVRSARRAAAIAHLIDPCQAVGQWLTVNTSGQANRNFPEAGLAVALEHQTRAALRDGKSTPAYLDQVEAFIEVIPPPVRLLVFGAGDDAVPLTAFAKQLGWHVSVFDGRAHYARRDKFPLADEVSVRPAGQSGVEIDGWTAAVLMSHSYAQDLKTLLELAPQQPRYLGLLGPRKRTARLLEEAGMSGSHLGAALHSPVGLDIGADGPEQVALAVVAEIQATLNGRIGGQLRDRAGSIHAPEDNPASPESFWVQSIVCA
jgi:xanthine/CO dehydrogenase XdhC/CoxF family maturation factor